MQSNQVPLSEDALFHLGGKTSDFVIVPAQIRRLHIKLEEIEKPIAAIEYNGFTYSLFRTTSNWAELVKITGRLNVAYVITVISKGWAIWVFEY
ncbi:MAG: hypothetical protein NW214_14490 [Pseudanabaenaceae cyanobacterium bins.39]|nr:hypothetical protein [Pseudanabaenaceae cyanobacterium bins.39]